MNEEQQIYQEILEAQSALNIAAQNFSYADPAYVDAAVLGFSAAQARFDAAVKRAKDAGLRYSPRLEAVLSSY